MALSVHAVVNTVLSMASATLATVIFDWVFNEGVNDIFETCNGLLGGLVAVTAGCAFMSNWAALVCGIISSILTKKSAELMLRLRIDDPLDAFSVHGANGIFATLWVGLVARPDLIEQHYAYEYHPKGHWGLFYGGSGSLMLIQLQGIVAVSAFVAVAMMTWILLVTSLSAALRSSRAKTKAEDDGKDAPSNKVVRIASVACAQECVRGLVQGRAAHNHPLPPFGSARRPRVSTVAEGRRVCWAWCDRTYACQRRLSSLGLTMCTTEEVRSS